MLLSADHAIPLGLLIDELVTNAVKYAYPEGTGDIEVWAREIDGRLHADRSTIQFEREAPCVHAATAREFRKSRQPAADQSEHQSGNAGGNDRHHSIRQKIMACGICLVGFTNGIRPEVMSRDQV
jgi:two-component sensor histidine kinase